MHPAGCMQASESRVPQPAPINYDLLADFVLGLVDRTYQASFKLLHFAKRTKNILGAWANQWQASTWPADGSILIFMPGAGEISRSLADSMSLRHVHEDFTRLRERPK